MCLRKKYFCPIAHTVQYSIEAQQLVFEKTWPFGGSNYKITQTLALSSNVISSDVQGPQHKKPRETLKRYAH